MDFSEGLATGMSINNGGNGGSRSGDWNESWIWIILIFALLGFGNRGYGNTSGGSTGGATDGYVLATDFATLERKLDGVNNGLCDGFYSTNSTLLQGFSGLQNTVNQGFYGLQNTITSQGYETRLGTQQLSSQLASCCCDIRTGIADNKTQGIMNTNAIATQISNCCCENEKSLMQLNYNLATQNCATLQAIDKVGDRVIDYLAAKEAAQLRDENQALRLAASQSRQNADIINALRPYPTPSYNVPNPFAYNGGCGCGYYA